MAKTYTALTPGNATAGNAILATDHSAAFTNINNLRVPPMCRATKNATQSIPHATGTAITFATEDYDTDDMHSTLSNTSRITINTAGIYLVSGFVLTTATTAPYNYTYVWKNGTQFSGNSATVAMTSDAANAKFGWFSIPLSLAVNDYVELAYYQNSGGAINVTADCWLSAVWLGQVS